MALAVESREVAGGGWSEVSAPALSIVQGFGVIYVRSRYLALYFRSKDLRNPFRRIGFGNCTPKRVFWEMHSLYILKV